METIGISCSCSNTEAFKLSNIAAECTSCSTVHTITDVPTYITRSITPLHVIEQRAKDQAIKDMIIMGSFDINGDIADWSNCFDTDNISDEITEEEYMLWHIKRGTRHSAMKDIRRDFREDFLLRPFYELEIGK